MSNQWVYIQSESGPDRLYTVGFYAPNGKWHPDSDHADSEEAAKRVHYLNGGHTQSAVSATVAHPGLLKLLAWLQAEYMDPRAGENRENTISEHMATIRGLHAAPAASSPEPIITYELGCYCQDAEGLVKCQRVDGIPACEYAPAASLSTERASPQENKAGSSSVGGNFKASDSGPTLAAADSPSRGLPNNPAGDAPAASPVAAQEPVDMDEHLRMLTSVHNACMYRSTCLAVARAPQSLRTEAALVSLDTPERVCFYEQEFYVLSNFSAFRLRWAGRSFDTSEAAYHWEKFHDRDKHQENILTAGSAHEAFKYAERHKADRRPDWDAVKVDIMRDILRTKAAQHEYVRRKLLESGDRLLVENSWRDDYWGWGPNRDGQNMLGKLWMEIRAEIRCGMNSRQDSDG